MFSFLLSAYLSQRDSHINRHMKIEDMLVEGRDWLKKFRLNPNTVIMNNSLPPTGTVPLYPFLLLYCYLMLICTIL